MKIIAMPTLCADIFEATGEILPGGEALNFAAHACKYPHIDVALVGAIGDDEVGQHVLRSIATRPIGREGVHIIPGGETASHFISTDENGDRYFKPGAWHGGVFQEFRLSAADEALLQSADVVFITWSAPNFAQVFELRKRSAFRLAVDFDVCRDFAAMEEALPWVDFFFISGETDERVPAAARKWSKRHGGLFNVTFAAQGSATYRSGEEHRVCAVPVDRVIDTTGCGDSYHAGFLCRYLLDGDVIAAMQEGSRVASETLGHTGGF